jgi:site-specific DNA-methyltransferase (cytosine-N4-specific)
LQSKFVNQILHGSALEKLKELESESVDTIICSPPYWALRSYKTEGQIWDGDSTNCEHEWTTINTKLHAGRGDAQKSGKYSEQEPIPDTPISYGSCKKCNAWKGELGQEPTIDLYVNHLVSIFDECKRVLKKSGSCWIVLGDTYSGGNRAKSTDETKYFDKKYPTKPKPAHAPNRMGCGFPDKSLCMIPERFAIKMIDNGWILRNKIIWKKDNAMPSSAKDRFTVDYECVYFFTKSKKYYFNTQYEKAISHGTGWGGDVFKPKKETSKYLQTDDDGKVYSLRTKNRKEVNMYLNGDQRIKRCVWSINTTAFPEAHFAVFPEQLVKQCLDAGCPSPEGLVLDMFMGSGTTALVALKNNRRFIGIELSSDYIKIAQKRIEPYLLQSKLI